MINHRKGRVLLSAQLSITDEKIEGDICEQYRVINQYSSHTQIYLLRR